MSDPRARTRPAAETVRLARASFDRCVGQPDFLRAFYATFMRNCPEAAPMFANSDFERLPRLLQHALALLLVHPTQPEGEPTPLRRVAERHSRRDLDVSPSLYAPFLDSLMQTVRARDPEYTPDIEAAWRATLEPGIEYMRSRY